MLAALVVAGCDGDHLPLDYWDGRRKAQDIVKLLASQQGEAVAAGSPLFGKAGTLGPTGKLSLSLRAQRVGRSTPSVTGTTISTGGEESATFTTSKGAVTAVSADAGVALGAEVGRLGGPTSGGAYNRFEGRSDWSRTYLSVGARIGP